MWLMCSECGATLPSAQARCPVCGRQPPAANPAPRRGHRAAWIVAVVLVLLGGTAAGVLLLKPPLLVSWADRTELPAG